MKHVAAGDERNPWTPASEPALCDQRGLRAIRGRRLETTAPDVGYAALRTQDSNLHSPVDPDDHVCLCFRVSLRKLTNYMNQTQPHVPSQLSECLGAGTGCHWCVPFLKKIHEQWQRGETPHLPIAPAEYAARRKRYHKTGTRDDAAEQGE